MRSPSLAWEFLLIRAWKAKNKAEGCFLLWSSEVLLWGWLHSRSVCPGSRGSPIVQPKSGQETLALGNRWICGGSLAVGSFSCRDVAQCALAKEREGGVKTGWQQCYEQGSGGKECNTLADTTDAPKIAGKIASGLGTPEWREHGASLPT